MPTLSDIFNLDPNVERLTLLPRLRGSLPSEKSVMMPDRYMFDVIAPKFLYDFIRAVKAPGRAAKGEALDEEEALNTAMNMFGGGLATSGSVPLGALGMSARTAPAGSIPLREVPRSPLGFYSKVEEATLPLQNKGSGSQFLAQIQKTPGVKPEEIEVLGLDKFLQSKPTVTKQEIQDYITANKPDVQETILGGGADIRAKADIDYAEGRLTRDEYNQILETSGKPSKFGSYTIPGGENYREILLKTPEKGERIFPTIEEWHDKTHVQPFSEVQQNPRLLEFAIRQYEREKSAFAKNPNLYYSSHFPGEANILTHLRANDRVIDGKKALFIEEIQSDWHQAGRKKGYNKLPDDAQVVQSPYSGNFIVQRANGNYLGESAETREGAIQSAIKHFGGVPDAPFKKSWHELALKRAIQEAVDKGYDKLAFTTGKTQAERYDLSKQVDELLYKKNPDGTYRLSAQVRGRGQSFGNSIPESKLEEYVGKEVAKSITQGSGKDVNLGGPGSFTQPRNDWKSMSGLDLKVGGEGMKGFYDEILPKALQNLTKKYGTKVTKTTMPGDYTRDAHGIPSMRPEQIEVWSMDITPQMREQIKAKGQPLFATAPPLGLATQDPLEQFVGAEQPKFNEQDFDPLMRYLGYK